MNHTSAVPADPVDANASSSASPVPRSAELDREEPEFVNESDLPEPDPRPHATPKAAHDAAGPESVAGEEDPGGGLDGPGGVDQDP